MDRTMGRNNGVRHDQKLTRLLVAVAAVMLLCGLFAQITVRAQVTSQAKKIAAVQAQLCLMDAEAENISMCINQFHNLKKIGERAVELGMQEATEDRMRVVSLSNANANTSTQSVALGDSEEMGG